MTALSLNLTPAKSNATGIALEGLPPLEAGRSVPAGFAEALRKLTGEAREPADDTPQGAAAADAAAIADADAPETGEATSLDPSTDQAETEAPPLPAGGKPLPVERTELAALQDPETQSGQTTDAPATDEGDAGAKAASTKDDTLTAPVPADLPPTGANTGARRADGDAASKSIAQFTAPIAAATGTMAGTPAVGTEAASAAGAVPIALRSVAGETTVSAKPSAKGENPLSSSLQAQGPLAHGPGSQADGTGQRQDASSGEQGRRGEGQSSRDAGAPNPGTANQARQDNAQTGLILQLRASDRPMPAKASIAEPGATQSSGSTLSTGASPFAVSPFGPAAANTAPGVAASAGQIPHFPELAAMVDRIAAARDSAGSASATIALAHKELGNLSLTFEATGRTLAVEVAAQDSDTQRALAAAIAADRPQLRAGEAQAQPHAGGQGTGSGTADQSGAAGDSRQDRRERRGESGPGTAPDAHRQPKSDDAIYA